MEWQPSSTAPRISFSVTPLQLQMNMETGLLIGTILNKIVAKMDPEIKPPTSAPENPPGEAGAAIPSEALLQGRAEVLIRHEGRLYRLRRTRLGKLILTA